MGMHLDCGGIDWPPEVFVRPLVHDEAVRLKRLAKRAKHESTRQPAAILLASNVSMSARQIAQMWRIDASHVRKVIHEFIERGMNSLRPRCRGGASADSWWPACESATAAVKRIAHDTRGAQALPSNEETPTFAGVLRMELGGLEPPTSWVRSTLRGA